MCRGCGWRVARQPKGTDGGDSVWVSDEKSEIRLLDDIILQNDSFSAN